MEAYRPVIAKLRRHAAILQSNRGSYWLLAVKGLFLANLQKQRLDYYHNLQRNINQDRITGIATYGKGIVLVADTALFFLDANRQIAKIVPYTFVSPHLFNNRRSWKDDSPVVRKDGSLVIIDEDRLIIYNPLNNGFMVKPLPALKLYVRPCHVQDKFGNILFSFFGDIYQLTPANELSMWHHESVSLNAAISAMLLDKSGVLWVGTTGYGLRQFDLRMQHMPSYFYHSKFTQDVLEGFVGIPSGSIANSALNNDDAYLFRWAKEMNGKLWMSIAGSDHAMQPNICSYSNGKLTTGNWRYADNDTVGRTRINALALSSTGKLWGIDYAFRLLQFDTVNNTVAVRGQMTTPGAENIHEINSLLVDGETVFWVSTSLGLARYDVATNQTLLFNDKMPSTVFTAISNGLMDKNTIWIGTKGSGIIKFNKKNYSLTSYTTYNELPNNTVYAILPSGNKLWCSSNKGIFSLDTQSLAVRSYTMLDGLPDDEFNSFHYLSLPNGQLAFGGTDGYTVFDPKVISSDDYTPRLCLRV